MAGRSKRFREMREKIDKDRLHGIDEALGLLKSLANAKFQESVDVSVNLGVDPRKSDQVVRGSTSGIAWCWVRRLYSKCWVV